MGGRRRLKLPKITFCPSRRDFDIRGFPAQSRKMKVSMDCASNCCGLVQRRD